ncbi:MAG: hypothetical protein HXY34_12090 [Candidatus Thorarchaeota archaeon]|nr:hypothetical protein [Candidatus Thorarchaeota archaeon]
MNSTGKPLHQAETVVQDPTHGHSIQEDAIVSVKNAVNLFCPESVEVNVPVSCQFQQVRTYGTV